MPTEYAIQVCHLWSWLGGALLRSEASPRVCWFWSLSGWAPGQAKVSRHSCPAQGHLVGAAKLSVVGCHLCWPRRCLGEATLGAEAAVTHAGWGPWRAPRCEPHHHLSCQVCGHLVEATSQANTGHSLCQDGGHLMGVTMRAETGCHLRWARGHLARGTGQSQTLLVRSLWTFESSW